MTTFLRLLATKADEKGATLAAAAGEWRLGTVPDGIFQVDPSSFGKVPGSPLAYWVSEGMRSLFVGLAPFEREDRSIKQGLATADDFRFVRGWWETQLDPVEQKWRPFAKGGSYSPLYSDVHLLVNWENEGLEIWNNLNERGQVRSNIWMLKGTSQDFFFRPGLTWPRRSQVGFGVRILPAGCVFSDMSATVFVASDDRAELLNDVSVLTSAAFLGLVQMQMAFGKYEVGTVQRTVAPGRSDSRLHALADSGWRTARQADLASQLSHAFVLPALLTVRGKALRQRADAWRSHLLEVGSELVQLRAEIDDIVFDLYGLSGEDRRRLEEGFGGLVSSEEVDDDTANDDEAGDEVDGADSLALTEALLEWTVGVALGRFDIRLATGNRVPPPEPDPFDPLPICSAGMLQDKGGLPAYNAPVGYPLELPPHGILVDDPGHPWDVVARIEAVFDLMAGDRAHAWIQEAEEILGRDLRDWIRRYGFERHLKRYSKSRRKAPLFWHLAPKSREYGIWLYSPVATRDTFYRVQNDYVDPKLKSAERRLLDLRQSAGGNLTGQQRKDLTAQESLVEELRTFREQMALVAPLWKPHRDDGVVLNCAALSGLFDHHRAWQKECAKKWDELKAGKYDWAGWAMHLWPERVVTTAASDRSIAIAHGLEEVLWEENKDGKCERRIDAAQQITKLAAERRSPAIEAALDAFVRAG